MELVVSRCARCGLEKSNLQRCGRCRDATYCSKECQKSHWEFHRPLCEKKLIDLEKERPSDVTPNIEREWTEWKHKQLGNIQFLFAAVVNGTEQKSITMYLSYEPSEIPAKKFKIRNVTAGDFGIIPQYLEERIGKYTGYYVAICPEAFGRIFRSVPILFQSERPVLYSDMVAHRVTKAEIGNEIEHITKMINDATSLNDSQFRKWLRKHNKSNQK